MRLLQSEINVVPGAKPNRAARPEGWVGDGAATLLISNATNLVNDYTIRVECDHPYWQAGWFRITALPAEGAPENQPPTGKPDQAGPKNQSLVMHINANGARKALLEIATPKSSEARAGIYHLRVVIESRVTDATVSAAPPHFTRIPATVIMRPFYEDWICEFVPLDKRVGFFRRTAKMELSITNRNNDWLYCDIKATKSQQVIPNTHVVRVAIPPPEPGRDSSRSIPITAHTKRRVFRSDPVTDPVPFAVVRVDAPSVPALPEDWTTGGHAGLGASVLTQETKNEKPPEEAGTITYCAPIRASLAGFAQALVKNIKGCFFGLFGLFIVILGLRLGYEHITARYNDVHVSGNQNDKDEFVVDNKGELALSGTIIANCTLEITWEDQTKGVHTCEINTAGMKLRPTNEFHTQGAMAVPLIAQEGETPTNGTIKKIRVYRKIWFFPAKALPAKELDKTIRVGYIGAGVTSNGPSGLTLTGDDFGDERGSWSVKGNEHALTLSGHWTKSHLQFILSPDYADKKFELTIRRKRDEAIETVNIEPGVKKPDEIPVDGAPPVGPDGKPLPVTPYEQLPSGGGGSPGASGGGGQQSGGASAPPGYVATINAIAAESAGASTQEAVAAMKAAGEALGTPSTEDDKALKAYISAASGESDVTEGLAESPLVMVARAKELETRRLPDAEKAFRKASAKNGGKFLPVLAYVSYLKRHGKSYGDDLSYAKTLAKTPEETAALKACE